MSVEAPGISKERVIRATVLTTAVIAASSVSVFVVKEVSRRKAEDKRVIEEGNRNSGDFGGSFSANG